MTKSNYLLSLIIGGIYLILSMPSCVPSAKPTSFDWLGSQILTPEPNSHDEGTEDIVLIGIHNGENSALRIPISHQQPNYFRIVYDGDTLPLRTTASEDGGYWILWEDQTDTLLLTTPVALPQWPGNDTIAIHAILQNGNVQVCLPIDSTNCQWQSVNRSRQYFFRTGPNLPIN